jgi:hypothetical protein
VRGAHPGHPRRPVGAVRGPPRQPALQPAGYNPGPTRSGL